MPNNGRNNCPREKTPRCRASSDETSAGERVSKPRCELKDSSMSRTSCHSLTGIVSISLIAMFFLKPSDVLGSNAQPDSIKECGECHMVYPARMLPRKSWQLIMGNLKSHFGEVVSLSDDDAKKVLEYLTENAADSPSATPQQRHFITEIVPDSAPLRITRTPWWNQMHADFDFEAVKHTSVKSASNCLACHPSGVK
jgi:hypothetical protein